MSGIDTCVFLSDSCQVIVWKTVEWLLSAKYWWCQVMLDIYVLVLTAACYVSVCENVVHEARVSVGCIVYVELSVPPLVQYPPCVTFMGRLPFLLCVC